MIDHAAKGKPVPIHRVSRDAFVGWDTIPSAPESLEALIARWTNAGCPADSQYGACGWVRAHADSLLKTPRVVERARPCEIPGFLIAPVKGRGVLAFEKESASFCGALVGPNLFVLPEFQGYGLGAELLIEAYENGIRFADRRETGVLTEAGRANRASAHRKAVERALDRDLDVPGEVLADYPELLSKTEPAPVF